MLKRGQTSGASAAALIGLITLVFIFYILFLPPAEREALLQEEPKPILAGDDTQEEFEVGLENILLDVPVGRLEAVSRTEFEHVIPNVILSEVKNAQVLATINPFQISRSLFGGNNKAVSFVLPDTQNLENILLIFATPKHEGTLKIKLNGFEIFEGDIEVYNPPPVELRKQMLSQVNTLEFEIVSSSITKKVYGFENMKIIGDLREVSRQRSENIFSVASEEVNNFRKATLNFYAICQQDYTGVLEIRLNDKAVYSSVPLCDSLNRIELFEKDFNVGRNTLLFSLGRGTATVEQIRIKVEIDPSRSFIRYFNIDRSLQNDLLLERKWVVLSLEFVDDGSVKAANLNVNGRLEAIDQTSPLFEKDISTLVKAGNNFVEITPTKAVDIVELQVRVEE